MKRKTYVCDNVLMDDYGTNFVFYYEYGEAELRYDSDDFVYNPAYSPVEFKTAEEAEKEAQTIIAENAKDAGFTKKESEAIADRLISIVKAHNWIGFKWDKDDN